MQELKETDLCGISYQAPAAGRGNSPPFSFSNGKDVIRRVCSNFLDVKVEWRHAPPLDQFSNLGCPDTITKKTETTISLVVGSDEVPAESRGSIPYGE